MSHDGVQCPRCGSDNVARYIIGLVGMTPELVEEERQGKVIICGCIKTGLDPKWHCNTCQHSWPTLEERLEECKASQD